MTQTSFHLVLSILALSLTGCGGGTMRPVLYPNEKLESVGQEVAQQDIDRCLARAREQGAGSGRTGDAAGGAVRAGIIGGAVGAVSGSFFGEAGRGAGAGAAGAATGGLLGGLFRSREPDPVFKNFVEKCLREHGYEPIGWRKAPRR